VEYEECSCFVPGLTDLAVGNNSTDLSLKGTAVAVPQIGIVELVEEPTRCSPQKTNPQ
jgi:hypothetical protein